MVSSSAQFQPQNLTSNSRENLKSDKLAVSSSLPQQTPSLSQENSDVDLRRFYSRDQPEALKSRQLPPFSVPSQSQHFSHSSVSQDFMHYANHLNFKASQLSTQEKFGLPDNQRVNQTQSHPKLSQEENLKIQAETHKPDSSSQSETRTHISAQSANQTAPSENQTAPTNQGQDNNSDRQGESSQISPVPSSQIPEHLTRTPLEDPMVDGEKISPIASDRPNHAQAHVDQTPEPPFSDLSPTTTTSTTKPSQEVSPVSNMEPMKITSTPIPPRDLERDLDLELERKREPTALDKLKSLASRTDDIAQGHLRPDLGQGQSVIKSTHEENMQRMSERRSSYPSSEYSSDSEER